VAPAWLQEFSNGRFQRRISMAYVSSIDRPLGYRTAEGHNQAGSLAGWRKVEKRRNILKRGSSSDTTRLDLITFLVLLWAHPSLPTDCAGHVGQSIWTPSSHQAATCAGRLRLWTCQRPGYLRQMDSSEYPNRVPPRSMETKFIRHGKDAVRHTDIKSLTDRARS
jgi:hypothetical protein